MCNGHERECVQESYNLLNEFANELYGKEEFQAQNTPKEAMSDNKDNKEEEKEKSEETKKKEDSESEEDDLDIDAAIKADVSELQKDGDKKERRRRRFQQVECAAKNCIFISTTLENPLELSMKIMDSILETQKQRTKKLLRMIPVQKTCKAFQKDIEGALETLAKSYFEKESKTYCIVSKIRNNSLIKREDLTQSLISVLQGANSENAPDLKTPDVVNFTLRWTHHGAGDVTPALNKNVFLIESACKSKPTYRAWCAVESFSRENPEADVWFVMTSPTVNDDEGLPSRLLQNYTNLHVVTTDLGTVFKDTLLEEFFMSGRWHRDTPWPMIQLSDILRVALLWRFGGFYTDIDTVCLKNISPLRNFVLAGRSARNQIANGAFHFEHHHEFLAFLMPQMIAEYKPKLWGSMGPITMTKCIKNLCKIPDMRQIFPSNSSEPVKCGNITIIPNEYLLPYPWWEYKKVYEPGKWQEFMAQFKNKSYSIHAYENKSKRLKIVQGSDSVYEGAARNFCPFTHPLLA
ncbi:putative lactosylceramide 4-alpha-galactosyltransferase isoform X3 [Penaeus vannamei]|uniref:Putative lactosylceramide 4-alpha-galactosyltransferase isoform X3 n=1 Tax=Penaeus vannamei TaxID=6689 RepID=A0A423SN58_PENVA|nr:putative lactosylceramide 4-alpha-galactosyltransferase isoform X3 [Penaeus vannamei]